jgi:two-component system, OmpR family, sensor histidine kinase KdpD
MLFLHTNKLPKATQYLVSTLLIVVVAGVCYTLSGYTGYRVVALLLLLAVSVLAMLFEVLPVLVAAALSALIWNFFFIPPTFTFAITNTEDALMFLMYFIIAMVNAVLTYQIRSIEKANRHKAEREHTLQLYNTLLNSLSHELRTPIATIIGATDNLQMRDNRLSANDKTALLHEVSKAALRLNTQVENLLNMSRLESGFIAPKRDWCDINELLHEVVQHAADDLVGRPVRILVKAQLPLFKIDGGLMHQVLYNLVQNATLYTPEGTAITLEAYLMKEISGHFDNSANPEMHRDDELQRLCMTVTDAGKGFPVAEMNEVFDKFYRGKNTNTGGTGLGLSIAKGFITAHNGTIALVNMPEGGARFTIEIPAETSFLNQLKNE